MNTDKDKEDNIDKDKIEMNKENIKLAYNTMMEVARLSMKSIYNKGESNITWESDKDWKEIKNKTWKSMEEHIDDKFIKDTSINIKENPSLKLAGLVLNTFLLSLKK